MPKSGDCVTINACLEEGADLNARDAAGWTPLMHAADQAKDEACTFLIDRGADMTALNALGESVWVVATKDTYRQRVPLILIAKGLNIPNVKLKPFIEVGNAPICR
ncbi:MAG: ankyrin repeat domain-containing protein, partial [Desulfobaccales bacterium]